MYEHLNEKCPDDGSFYMIQFPGFIRSYETCRTLYEDALKKMEDAKIEYELDKAYKSFKMITNNSEEMKRIYDEICVRCRDDQNSCAKLNEAISATFNCAKGGKFLCYGSFTALGPFFLWGPYF